MPIRKIPAVVYPVFVLKERSLKLERIDTGDYTAAEYERFLREIRLINRLIGDRRALRRSLLREILLNDVREFSVLDVGAGSGELLREIARFARKRSKQAFLMGLELNDRSAREILKESKDFPEIRAVRGDALHLPFAGKSFDYSICSLFTHHLSDENIVRALSEMKRVSRRAVYVIDLHRHPLAYVSYKAFCAAFRISELVRHDGSLSILRGFKAFELEELARRAKLRRVSVTRSFPFRLILRAADQADFDR